MPPTVAGAAVATAAAAAAASADAVSAGRGHKSIHLSLSGCRLRLPQSPDSEPQLLPLPALALLQKRFNKNA